MPAASNRRDFLRTLIGGVAGFSLAQASQTIEFAPLTNSIGLVTGAGGNIVVLSGGDGLLLVNGSLPEHSADLMKFLGDQFKGQRISVAFNTDWHIEHTGSNEALRKAGAKIIAHENTKLWIGADFVSDWQNKRYKPRPSQAFPTETFYTNGKMTFGGEPIEYGYLAQAHTDGDIYVFFPKQNVLVAGDVLAVNQYPILDYVTGGWIGGLQNANQALLKIANADTKIVPGSGPVQTRADLQSQSDMCNAMRD